MKHPFAQELDLLESFYGYKSLIQTIQFNTNSELI